MRASRKLLPLLILAFVVKVPAAHAQVAINPYVGVLILDDSGVDTVIEFDPAALVGARLVVGVGGPWGIEGAYGYAPISSDNLEGETIDFDAHLVYGGVNYLFGPDGGTNLLLAGGFGITALVSEDDDADAGVDPILSLGAGFTHPIGDRVNLRGEVRDHIAFCGAPLEPGDDLDDLEEASPCFFEDETLNHIEVSGGIEIWL